LRTQYLSIGDTGAHATFLSRPTWLWGAEHGVNEHGVAIGNERVATVHDAAAAKPALIGMDLVRLGLERSSCAAEALDVIVDLLTTCGQGGIADAVHGEAYDSSFLIADPTQAIILDPSGTDYAAAPFPAGTAISNRHSLTTDWTRASDSLDTGDDFDRYRDHREHTAYADVRLAASRRFLAAQPPGGLTPAAMAAHLRDHGHGPWGAPGEGGPADPPPGELGPDFSGISVCMHVRDLSVTAASFVSVLPADLASGAPLRVFVAPGSPCVSIFVPAFPATAAGLPPFIPFELSSCGRRPTPCAGRWRTIRRRSRPSGTGSTRWRVNCGRRRTTCATALTCGETWAARGASGPSRPCSPAFPVPDSAPVVGTGPVHGTMVG
jgi:hypothetical protein